MNWNCTRINDDGSSCYGSMNNDGTCYPCDSEIDDPASVGGVGGGLGETPMGVRGAERESTKYVNFTTSVFKQPVMPALVMGMVIGVGLFASYQLTKTLKV